MTIPESNRRDFIANVRRALGHAADSGRRRRDQLFDRSTPPAAQSLLDTVRRRGRDDRLALLETFRRQAEPLNLAVAAVSDIEAAGAAVADIVATATPEWGDALAAVRWDHPLLDRLDLETRLDARQIVVKTTCLPTDVPEDEARERVRRRITAATVGITTVDFCLADTATLVMKSRAHQARAASLVPAVHVAVVRLEQMLADLKELVAVLRWDDRQWAEGLTHHMVMISGPSKTADIELVMVQGAHGPRAVHAVIITGD